MRDVSVQLDDVQYALLAEYARRRQLPTVADVMRQQAGDLLKHQTAFQSIATQAQRALEFPVETAQSAVSDPLQECISKFQAALRSIAQQAVSAEVGETPSESFDENSQRKEQFELITRQVLEKNKELYVRLAQ